MSPANEPDPFAVLGLDRSASLAEVRAARRRLAFDVHPDRGGDETRMRAVNVAFEAAVAHLTGRRLLPTAGAPRPAPAPDRGPRAPRRGSGAPDRLRESRRRVQRDLPSFVVEALPVEAYEALLVVASWMGEVLVDEPPYLLEVHLFDPSPCWCRLDLVPDAGGSTVSLTVAGDGAAEPPSVEDVRDAWVVNLNRL